jgi:hypothetical protein
MAEGQETQERQEKQIRLARTPEELIFNTDTDQSDYPIFVDPLSTRMYIKHEPEDIDHYSVFYVKSVVYVTKEDETMKIIEEAEKQGLFDKKAFELVLNTVKALLKAKVYHKEISYEVYKGNYEELVANVKAYAVFIETEVSRGWGNTVERGSSDEKRQWAIAYSYLKRLKAQLPANLHGNIYLKTQDVSKRRYRILLVIKFPIPVPEFNDAFNKAVLEYANEIQNLGTTAVGSAEEQLQQQTLQITLDVKPQELEVELPETPQPVPQPQPQAQQSMEVELENAPSSQATSMPQPAKQELVKIYLLAMRLPTKHLLMETDYERDDKTGTLREVRKWDTNIVQIASRVEGIRRDAYTRLSHVFCHVEEYGVWISVTEDGVKEAKEVSSFIISELKKLGIDKIKNINIEERYGVRAIPIYLEPSEAKVLLETAIKHLSEDVEELGRKIEEAKQNENRKYLRQLESEKKYREALLEAFKKYLSQL